MPTPAPAQKPCLECQLNGVVRVEEVEEVEGLAPHHQAHRVLLVAPLVLLHLAELGIRTRGNQGWTCIWEV